MKLENYRIASLVHNDFEDLELWYPILRLREEGAEVVVAGEKAGAKYHGKYGLPAESDVGFDALDSDRFDGLLVPGGWAPDKLRRFDEVLSFVRAMNDRQRVIGQICHAGWVLASAGILAGKHVTSTPGIRDDLENAGAHWQDTAVVRDGHIVSSRRPPDLPDYLRELIKVLAENARTSS